MTMNGKTGVFPCYKNQFQIGADADSLHNIADMESYSVKFDNGVEEWTPYDTEGWRRGLMTAKGVTISVSGKRHIGDAGNDFVAEKAFKNGRDAEGFFQWTMPTGDVIQFQDAIVNVTEGYAADSTNVAPLSFDIMSNGKPTFVEVEAQG